MKKLLTITFSLLLLCFAYNSKAQDTTTTEKLVRYLLQPLDKSQIPSGILEEYGAPILNLSAYNSLLTDSNKVSMVTWRTLLLQLNTSYCGNGTNPFPDITAVNNTIQQSVHDTLPVPVPLLIGSYHSIKTAAITNNLISFMGVPASFMMLATVRKALTWHIISLPLPRLPAKRTQVQYSLYSKII